MDLLEFLYALEPRLALAILLALSIVLYAVMANLAWASRKWTLLAGRRSRFILWASTSRIARVIGEIARWMYYLAIPWAALMLGYDTTRALGIWRMDWLAGLLPFAILVVGSGIVIIWVWRPYARTTHPHAIDETGWNWARQIVEMLYQEAHWAFYRSGPVIWIGDFYLGSLCGLALILLEGASNPFVRANVEEVTRADAPLWSTSLAIVSTLIFILTQNAWYSLIAHLLLALGLRGFIGFPRVHSIERSS